MGRMIKSKREWRCMKCEFPHSHWEGFCRNCKAQGTLQEIILTPTKAKPVATVNQRALLRRSKNSERAIAKRMLVADGPDHAFDKIATSTGRIGHITNIRVDAVSKNYCTENKNRNLPKWLVDSWILIQQKAIEFNKNFLLHLDPPNLPNEFSALGEMRKNQTMAVIGQDRHEDLIKSERILNELLQAIGNDERYKELIELYLKLRA